jgi:hypothetical protein
MTMPSIERLEDRAERLAAQLRRAGHLVTLAGAVSETTAAELIGVKPRTLRAWRSKRSGPGCYVAGRAWYPLAEIVRYLAGRTTGGSARQDSAADGSARQIAPCDASDDSQRMDS